MAKNYISANTLYLAGAGTIVGATSVVLTSLTDIYGNILTMADFGDLGYMTIEPDTNNEEQLTFTGVTANVNGTYTLTGVKTSLAKLPYTQTSGLVRQHSGGSKVVITDTAAFWAMMANKFNDMTIEGQWTFNNTPIVPGTVSDASTTVKGVAQISVAPVSAGTPISVGTNDPRMAAAYAVANSGTDDYTITTTPTETAYVTGKEYTFKADVGNTAGATLNVNGLGAKTIVKNLNIGLRTYDILAGQIVVCRYDGTNMQMVTPHKSFNTAVAYASTGTPSFPITIAHNLGVVPLDKDFVIISSNGAISFYKNGVGIGRLADGTNAGYSSMMVGADSSNYKILDLAVDATNVTISAVATAGSLASQTLQILGTLSAE